VKKPTNYSKPPGAPATSKTPAAAVFGASQAAPKASDNAEYSNKQEEVSTGASPDRNTVPESGDAGSGIPNPKAREGEDPAFSGKQEEFQTTATENAADAQPEFKLPDLTQGIPPTLEYELSGKLPKDDGLNVTEAPQTESGSSGRGKGELPDSAYVSSTERNRAKYANWMYLAFFASATVGAAYTGREWESEEEAARHKDIPSGWSPSAIYARIKARVGDQLGYYTEPAFQKLLPDPDPMFERPYTLILSLEDLLIHSEWTREHGWRMAKRPGLDYFLRYLSQYYELVIFTSVPFGVAEPVIRKLDPYHIVTFPLFREATNYKNGEYVKVSNAMIASHQV
jgi:import inner membrane translocase subunit TIM50